MPFPVSDPDEWVQVYPTQDIRPDSSDDTGFSVVMQEAAAGPVLETLGVTWKRAMRLAFFSDGIMNDSYAQVDSLPDAMGWFCKLAKCELDSGRQTTPHQMTVMVAPEGSLQIPLLIHAVRENTTIKCSAVTVGPLPT